jgi:hypothetical protein
MRSGLLAPVRRVNATFVAAIIALSGMTACGAQVINGRDPAPDAAPADTEIDAAPGDDAALPGPDAAMARCASRTVFLNFEGQALQQGPSDATMNRASWMQIAAGTAPKYLNGNGNRNATIQTIVDGVRAQLAQFPVTVVTTRPISRAYVMIVFGGQMNQVGSRYTGAVNTLDCEDVRPNDVAWISDSVAPTQVVINYAVGAIGFGLGLTATTDPSDCMCSWDNGCQPNGGAPCRLSAPIARDPNANQRCPTASPSQDEVATFRKAFCE